MNIKLWRKNFFFNFFCKKLKSVYQRQQPSRSRYLFYPRSLTIHYHLLLSSIMESLAESSCRGLTKTGTQCARQVNLSENGYCYQHVDQDNDPEVPASFAQPPAGADPHSVGPAVPEPFTIPAAFNPVLLPPSPFRHSEGNSNNDDDSQQQSVDDTDQKGRCHAISNSTRTRCKKMVSVVGQRFCPSHGGTQIRAKIILAMCSAISKTTRQPCKNHVAVMGQKFCNHHGGLAKTSSIVEQQPNIAYPMTNPITLFPPSPNTVSATMTTTVPLTAPSTAVWSAIQACCVTYLLDVHPLLQCVCTPNEPCKGMALIKWIQPLARLAQSSPGLSILNASAKDLVAFVPTAANKHPFADLYLAVEMFGSNISFLPQLFKHIQDEQRKRAVGVGQDVARGQEEQSRVSAPASDESF
jgi:hypothetical protein